MQYTYTTTHVLQVWHNWPWMNMQMLQTWLCPSCLQTGLGNFSDSFFNESVNVILSHSISVSSNDSTGDSTLSDQSDMDHTNYRINSMLNIRASNRHNFIAGYLNINSYRDKYPSVVNILNKNGMDLLCIAVYDSNLAAYNYRVYRTDSKANFGGFYVYVKGELPSRCRHDLEMKTIECIFIEVSITNSKWLFACCYRLPSIHYKVLKEELVKAMDNISIFYDRYMVLGDFNENLDKKPVNQLMDIMDTVGASNIIQGPTCFKSPSGTLIDLVITPNKRSIKSHCHFDTGLIDFHHLIYVVLKSYTPRLLPCGVTCMAYKGFIPENYISDLQYAPF